MKFQTLGLDCLQTRRLKAVRGNLVVRESKSPKVEEGKIVYSFAICFAHISSFNKQTIV